jgi:hypothetical protein
MKMLFVKILNTAVFLQGVKFLSYQIQKVVIKVKVMNISTVWKSVDLKLMICCITELNVQGWKGWVKYIQL